MALKLSSLFAVAGVSVFGLISHASAATVDVTFTGTVISTGYDQSNIFGYGGSPPTSYTGDHISYTANFIFNTALGSSSSSSTESEVFGGTLYGAASPLVSASVTINGHTANIPGTYASEIFACSTCQSGSGELYASAQYKDDNGSTTANDLTYIEIFGALPASIASGTYSSSSGLTGVAHVSFNTTADNSSLGTGVDTFFEASLTSVSETVSATPLPSTWIMLLSGFVGCGFFAYRGTKKNAASLSLAPNRNLI